MKQSGLPHVAFSTLACPAWDADEVVERAARAGYDAIEWRGGTEGTVATTWSPSQRSALRRRIQDAGLRSLAVTTYTELISGDRSVRRRSVDDARAHAELARDLGAATIRVFLGVRDDAAPAAELTARAIDALQDIVERVRPTGIGVAIEPHDDHVRAASIRPILDSIRDAAVGIVWDIANAWSVGEPPATGLAAYAGRIAYVQVKDGTGTGPSWRLCALGEGEVPLDEALVALVLACKTSGTALPPISFEWERAWHDHLAPAEEALAPARAWLATHLQAALSVQSTRAG